MTGSDERIGTDIGGYRLEAIVGRGGMGVVYRAEQRRLGRKVALKLLAPELAENEGFRARFESESRLAAAIDHPNIIPLYEAGETEGLVFITMRYVEGTDLKALIARHGRLDPGRAIGIVSQVASALDAAHARHLVHRDVKPGNILLTETGAGDHCYLADFGLTKDTAVDSGLTGTGQFVGTIAYVSPEQIEARPADGRADQYALGCVLYECLTGQPPYSGATDVAVLWGHLGSEPPRASDVAAGLPPGLDGVIAKALSKAAEDRYTTCSEFAAAARAVLVGAEPRPAEVAAPAAPAAVTEARDQPPAAPTVVVGGAETALAESPLPAAPTRGRVDALQPPPPADAAPAPAPAAVAAPRRAPAIALGVAVVLAAAAAGAFVGRSDDAAPAQPVSAGPVALRVPDGWERGGDPGAIAGLRLAGGAIALRPRAGEGVVAAGTVADPGPALLPETIEPTAPLESVRLGSIGALRHRGSGATVYLVPTSGSVVAVGCAAPVAASDCDRLAASLRVVGVRPVDPAPSAAYARSVGGALQALGRGRADGRRRLARARTPAAQAAAARSLATAHAAAARRLGADAEAGAARWAHGQIKGALDAAMAGYRSLATAARAHDGARYRAATRRVQRADADLRRALSGLELIGYQL